MRDTLRATVASRTALLVVVGTAATLTVFAIDIALPHDYNIAYLYVVTVVLSGFSAKSRMVIWTTIGAWVLTMGAFLLKELTQPHGASNPEVFSRIVALIVMALTATVVMWAIQRAAANIELGRALREAEDDRELDKRMLAAASAVTAIGTWSIDADGEGFAGSAEAAEMHGFAVGAPSRTEDVLSRMPAEHAQRLRDTLARAWTSDAPFREEYCINLPDGTQRWIVAMGEPLRRDHPGHPDGVVRLYGTAQDITPWKESELTASVQKNLFSQLMQMLPIIVWTALPNGTIDYVNDAILRYSGVTRDELPLDKWVELLHPDDAKESFEKWMECVALGTPYDIETRMRDAEGVYRWHHVSAEPERDKDGNIVRWWGTTVNVDAARRFREEADRLAEEREIVLESMSEGLYTLDHDRRFVYVNSSAERIMSVSRHDLIGTVLWDQYPGLVDTAFYTHLNRAIETGVPHRFLHRAITVDKWLEMSFTPSATGLTVFFHDATEVRQLSMRLAQSQRLEAIGQLTGGIAHDFNNLLTVVLGGADALVADGSLSDESKEMAQLIGSAAERGAELTHRLLAFARRQPLEPQSVDLSERLRTLEPLLRRTLGENISMVVVPDFAPPAEVDPGQFDNALLNLAINARDAMPQGGTLTVEVGAVSLDATYVTTHTDVAAGSYVVVTVTDSGAGIDPQDMGNLFDPFFTTKGMGKGSGLGLAMVWGFVKQSGGQITVYSEPGYGASFKMYLPVAATAPIEQRPSSDHVVTGPATGFILLAEDDDLVRVFATERLRAKGYHVVAASSGPEALEALEGMDKLDLLFTDVIMPGGMTGRELADAVIKKRPGTPVLYASGYTENVIVHNDRLDAGVKLLAKPYSTKQLMKRIGEMLAAVEGA